MAAGDRWQIPDGRQALDALRDTFIYEPDTGILRWKVDRRSGRGGSAFSARRGSEAGHVRLDEGRRAYRVVRFEGRRLTCHRVAWALYYGRWPDGVIDHIDGNGLNNRIANLRDCFSAENMRNRQLNINNTSGFKGVHLFGEGIWRARISVNGKKLSLGLFKTPEEAALAYDEAALRLHGEFARTNSMMRRLRTRMPSRYLAGQVPKDMEARW